MPAGNRLRPRADSACTAPASTTTRPAGLGPARIQRLRLSSGDSIAGKRVPSGSPGRGAQDHVRLAARGDDDVDAGVARRVGGGQLGRHPAHAQAGSRAARLRAQRVVDAIHLLDQLGVRVGARIAREEARLVSEHEQQVGADQRGDQRGEIVVVARP